MYLRHTIRKKDGKVHRYWCLVRSVRVGRRVIQQTVAQLGELDEQGQVRAQVLARRLIGRTAERDTLHAPGAAIDPFVTQLASLCATTTCVSVGP